MQKFSPITQQLAEAINTYDKQAVINIVEQADDIKVILDELSEQTPFEKTSYFYRRNTHNKGLNYQHLNQVYPLLQFVVAMSLSNQQDLDTYLSCLDLNRYLPSQGFSDLSEYYHNQLPDFWIAYYQKYIQQQQQQNLIVDFNLLWTLYQQGFIQYDETYFMRCLMELSWAKRRSTVDEAKLLINTPEVAKLLYKMTHYETAVLDRQQWDNATGGDCNRVTNFWDEVFDLMQQQGFEFDRAWLGDLLQSLTLPWKKPHLEWHCRVINFLQPSVDELIGYQTILFANLSSPVPSIIKYNLEWIERIYQDNRFDLQGFQDSLVQIFVLEKQAKTLLKALQMLIYSFEKYPPDIAYREQLALLLMQSDMKLQTQVATVLMQYFNDDRLAEVILPYQDYFNTKTQAVFEPILVNIQSPKTSVSDTQAEPPQPLAKPLSISDLTPISLPQTWHDVLFLLGDVVNYKSVSAIDVFFDSLVRLQDQIPSDFAKQIKPYSKKLSNYAWSGTNLRVLHDFVYQWVNGTAYNEERHPTCNASQYLVEKANLAEQKLISHDTLGFVATPTHEPFYLDPTVFLERLLAYQSANQEPEIHDLIVACNRLLYQNITPSHQITAKQLTGKYSKAIQYYFGVNDSLNPDETTLPLWTQITRIKEPNGIFNEFKSTSASDIPSVVEPFQLDYPIEHFHNGSGYYFYKIKATVKNSPHKFKWNQHWGDTTQWFDEKFYHAGGLKREEKAEVAYQLSLNPHYCEAQVCRYISDFSDSEVYEANGQLEPLKYLIEYELPIYHGGWLYIAISLLYGRRNIREFAYEYVLLAIRKGWQLDSLAVIVADLLAGQFAPINRFIEYLDKMDESPQVTVFKFAVLSHCIKKIDPANPPRGYKKLVAYQQEFSERVANLA